mgnify:CR=1 FL=1
MAHGTITNMEGDPTVLLFLGTTCPISNQYSPEVTRMCDGLRASGGSCILVYPEPGLTRDALKNHLNQYGLHFPAILDQDQALVQQMAATITPEAVVLSKSGEALYQGRIDDRYADLGKPRASAQSHDLQNALDDITNGRPIKTARTDAVGCFIEPLRH